MAKIGATAWQHKCEVAYSKAAILLPSLGIQSRGAFHGGSSGDWSSPRASSLTVHCTWT